MCGIAGILDYSNDPEVFGPIERMTAALGHRGPDYQDTKKLDLMALGHSRLSIIDVSAVANQPMSDSTGRYWIVFNGEIYNYRELQEELKPHYKFRSTSDTEALLYGYIRWGAGVLQKIRGMFAFAIWDSRERILFLARDRIGEKPLVYSFHNNVFYFSSEINSLLESGIPRRMSRIALWHFFETRNSIPPPLTGYENISKLEQGHYMVVKQGSVEKKKYWNLESRAESGVSEKEWEERFYQKLDEVVKMELVSDVPLGISLSGGVDSSSICALTREVRPDIQTFSMITTHADDPEKPRIDQIVKIFNLINTQFLFNEIMDFDSLLKLPGLYGEPYAHYPHLYVAFLYQNIRKSVKTVITGNGGDEVLAGYSGYQELVQNNKLQLLQNVLRFDGSGKSWGRLFMWRLGQKMFGRQKRLFTKEFIADANLAEIMEPYRHVFSNTSFGHFVPAKLHQDLLYYHYHGVVQMHDTAAMKYGLELRSPFLEHELIELIRKMPVNMLIGDNMNPLLNKFILKKSMERKLPKSLLYAKKLGFGYGVDINALMRDHWAGRIWELFSQKRELDKWISKPVLRTVWDEFLSGNNFSTATVIALITLFSWYDSYKPVLE